jgi:hypothetical protein
MIDPATSKEEKERIKEGPSGLLWPGYACYDQNKRKPLEAILLLNLEVQCQNKRKKELFIGRVRDQSDHPYAFLMRAIIFRNRPCPPVSFGCV